MQEEWKLISGYEGIYEVSNFGSIRSLDRIDSAGRCLKGVLFSTKAKKNYVTVRLSKDGKTVTHRLHRLVAEAFIPNPDNLPCVNHLDGNKQNNCSENLEWCTYSENNSHAYKVGLKQPIRKLDDKAIQKIIIEHGKLLALNLQKNMVCQFKQYAIFGRQVNDYTSQS